MQVLPINNLSNYRSVKNRKTVQNSASAKVQTMGDIPFKGSYKQTYLQALKTPIKDLWDCKALFRKLISAAKTENLNIKSDHYLNKEFSELLQTAKGINSEIILAKSNKYASPLVTLDRGSVEFHHPDYGKYGNGNISFFLDGSTVNLHKDHYAVGGSGTETFKFWDSGCIKEYTETCEGRVCESVRYNEDGSKKRGFFDFLFGD